LILGLIGAGLCVYLGRGGNQTTAAAQGAGMQQNAGIQQLLHNSTYPLKMQFKSLNGDWRRLSIGGQAEAGVHMELASSLADNVYYTRGETTVIGSETYLVAFNTYQPQKLTQDSNLTLNLVNLRATSGLYDITEVNVQDEIKRTNGANPQ
jgi:hypothetical protein